MSSTNSDDPSAPNAEVAPEATTEAPPEAAAPEAAPTKRKKRRKKAKDAPAEGAESKRPALDEKGQERPGFLLNFPEDAELEVVIRAFEVGNYRRVQQLAPELSQRHADPEVRAAAAELLQRIQPDPLVKFLYAVAVALFVAVVAWAYLGHR